MKIETIETGKDIPEKINVIIEISAGGLPVKYEFDKETQSIFVDRFLKTSMVYPCNYGFIPNTLSGDGDPQDVLVISSYPVISGAVLPARPVGVLLMEDESGMDEKIIAVPQKKIDPFYASIEDINDIGTEILSKIKHFFERYKDLDEGKWVKIIEYKDVLTAKSLIKEAYNRHKNNI